MKYKTFFFKAYFIQNKVHAGTKHNIQLEEEKKQSYTVNTVKLILINLSKEELRRKTGQAPFS